ncbi:argininosuccinate lyase [Limimaricola pyoseonensis]|uniref:Uncharacterized protein n=1 Tax=Limimaricola pyoseonensis TaxID=521013 RepID=A0A1G7JXU5_9RHOB|nr:argininosuccinate lyase [Limimaricola pyoseonensis]SDF29777.1 hypothetical protein SAMN04488567_0047 [Limimaricola pyoseonensis]
MRPALVALLLLAGCGAEAPPERAGATLDYGATGPGRTLGGLGEARP